MQQTSGIRAVVLVGHGSLRPTSGAAMIRIAARVQEAGVAPLAEAGFLNYSRPPFAETIRRTIERGASEVAVMPYFLVPGRFVSVALPRALAQIQHQHLHVPLRLARCFDDHPALAALVLRRAAAVDAPPEPVPTALLLMAHGSPDPAANTPIHGVAQRLAAGERFVAVQTCFLDLNAPSIADAIAALANNAIQRIVAVPYFLQLGGHVADDLPQIISQAQHRFPQTLIQLAPHLGYDPLFVDIIRDRINELWNPSPDFVT